ncbi:cobalamin biosynthesis protein [Nocardioides zeae]|uniref:Cobalamin biosynthesis protein CobD n=1 Tax=Nocardioides zeae TaxID=1457234 RepID=A0AAJ1X3P0_9ACTN|nr:cobalamin biosynthesis protein [Nocardioides zeae]MDQ1104737.1 adenosylcobinamide-phosphate synthase [Nocardioides zeae]
MVRPSRGAARAAGLALGVALDQLVGDPRRGHPVAGFGRVAGALEQRMHADSRARGAAYSLLLVGSTTVLGAAVERRVRRGAPALETVTVAAATWAVLGARSLDREAAAVQALLDAGDLPGARQRLTHLVGRRTAELSPEEVARAVAESVAENTSDAVVAPLVWGAVAGVPGLVGYRAANTLDAMVGHRNARFERFGWASARLDDVLNVPGARLSALLAAAAAPLVGGRPRDAFRAWRRDAGAHPSPNAGPVEASFAGALGVRLGGRTVYGAPGAPARVEDRPVLGDGRAVEVRDIARARHLARLVDLGAAVVAVAVASSWVGRRGKFVEVGRTAH